MKKCIIHNERQLMFIIQINKFIREKFPIKWIFFSNNLRPLPIDHESASKHEQCSIIALIRETRRDNKMMKAP